MRKFLRPIILMFLAWCFDAPAQTPANGWLIENIHGPSQVGIVDTIPVDINQDGLMDVVSASIEDGHLRAYINQGNYEFEQQYISKEVPGIYRVSATDINQDGLTDFLLPSIETHEIIVLIAENEGYRKQIIASDVILPTDAQAGDFDNDGLMDVVSISFEHHELILHLQQSDGTFHSQVISFSAQRPRKLQVADFNNDTYLDILLASSDDNSIRLFTNEGSAVFDETVISNQMTGTRFVTICDLNNDTYADFAVSATDADTAYIFANVDGQTFDAKAIDNDLPGVNALHCVDIDQDQQTELISIASTIGNIYTHELNGNFNKTLIANTRDGYVSVNSASFKPNDEPKILTQAYYENRNLFYQPDTSNQEQVVWEDFPEGVNSLKYADINKDGIEDVVVANFKGDCVQWFDGITNLKKIISDEIDGASEIYITDLDNDGEIDVLSVASYSSKVFFHKNLGNELFETIVLSDDVSFANGVIAVDVNGDAEDDVVVTSGTDDSVRWIQRDGNEYIEHIIDSSNDAPNDVKATDIDNDGDIDLIVAYFFSDEVSIYLNEASGLFSEITLDGNFDGPYEITVHHLNNDEYIDLIVTGAREGVVKQYLSIGNLKYVATELISLDNPREVRVDINGEIWISSPGEKFIIRINQDLFNETNLMVSGLLGVSDFDIKPSLTQFLTSSFDRNYVFSVTNDIIYNGKFE